MLASITEASDADRPSSIIKDYLLGEEERTKEGESEMHRRRYRLRSPFMTLQDLVGRLLVGAQLWTKPRIREGKGQ